MDPSSASTQAVHDTEDYLNFDPRTGRSRGPATTSNANRSKMTFSDALVFVVGSGSYVEYSDLLDLVNRSNTAQGNAAGYAAGPGRKRITYGAAEIHKPKEFLQALANLA